MSFEPDIVGSAAVAAVSGNFAGLVNTLDYIGEKFAVDAATGGRVQIDLDGLVDFYNQLSDLHEQLVEQVTDVRSAAESFYGLQGGGKVPGAQQAFKAMAEAAGLDGAGASLVANMQHVDMLVLQHMVALQHNAQQYAAQEGAVIHGLGQASRDGGGATPQREDAPIPDQPTPTRKTGTGIGGK